jgi:2-keto-3-deoxy-6-phosphogluconate aldolase
MRERWFGSTGRKVPEIALAGTIELGDALVLEDVSDLEAIRRAHEQGIPVVINASSPQEVVAALARGEVACALVHDESHLSLDLAELTYG